jgi:hypothetical protein
MGRKQNQQELVMSTHTQRVTWSETHVLLRRREILAKEIQQCEERLRQAKELARDIDLKLHFANQKPKLYDRTKLPEVKRKLIGVLACNRNQSIEDLRDHLCSISEAMLRAALKELRKQNAVQYSTRDQWNLNRLT